MKPWRKSALPLICLALCMLLSACGPATPAAAAATPAHTPAATAAVFCTATQPATVMPAPSPTHEPPSLKYVFLFIGDGMGFAQVEAAELLGGGLSFTDFPAQGSMTTFSADAAVTDSAASATAIACGVKTKNGLLGLAADEKTPLESIAYQYQKAGMKVGIVSSVPLNHATPAAFYAHSARSDYYGVAIQMADSGLDYFGGGALLESAGKGGGKPDAYAALAEKGYALARTREAILALDGTSGKTYALGPVTLEDCSLPYAGDISGQAVALEEFVQAGIRVLGSARGFFMMCESGKIDWACHLSDSAKAAGEVLALDRAVRAALAFGQAHPDETLIVVTADHETGGMTVDEKGIVRFAGASHTAADVPVYAWGAGAEEFIGSYDNTEIFWKFLRLCKLE